MTKLRVHAFSISLDGYGAGPRQDLENPLGVGGEALHNWAVVTPAFSELHGDLLAERQGGGGLGLDDDFVRRSFAGIGAWILGRNMFGPVRGPWTDDTWRGWWGEDPPYHTPVFVLTHYPRPPLEMKGGTTFHFVTGGIEDAWRQAADAAGGRDVRVGGGVATLRAYLRARLVDEMHLAIAPVLLGSGESLFADLDLLALGYRVSEHATSTAATHIVLTRGA